MSEFRRRFEPPSVSQQDPTQPDEENSALQSRSVRRNLFGPIDHDENVKFVQDELAKIAAADSGRWNFDFHNDRPLEGRYSWEEASGGQVPVAYDMPNLTAKLTLPNSCPSTSKLTNVISLPTPTDNYASTSSRKVDNVSTSTTSATENPLRTTLTAVTTATTTVMSLSPKNTSIASTEVTSKSVSQQSNSDNCNQNSTVQVEPSSTENLTKKVSNKKAKQTKITEFLKIRKRSYSSEIKVEAEDSVPVMKRAKTS